MTRTIWTTASLLLALGICSCGEIDHRTPGNSQGVHSAALEDAEGGVELLKLAMIEQLGKSIFFDENLSIHRNQSCAACHGEEAGWTGPLSATNDAGAVYEGSTSGRFGNRKPPSAAYATLSPVFHQDKQGLFIGGNFWDGRATGERLGNPAADQALGPFLNPVEQGLPDKACVVHRVCNPTLPADYPVAFGDVWAGSDCAISWPADIDSECAVDSGAVDLSAADRIKVERAYDNIGLSVGAYEGSSEVNRFDSKYDASLARSARLTRQEKKGLSLFRGKGKCAKCHVLGHGRKDLALFTDFTFDNLGIPRNPDNPWYTAPSDLNPDGFDWIDEGLGGFLEAASYPEEIVEEHRGYQRVPTLRNVATRPSGDPDFVKAYGHNGYFKSLTEIVHFYNTRDVKPVCEDDPKTPIDEARFTPASTAMALDCWPEPEVPESVNADELGDLGLSERDEAALVSFLETLSDGFDGPEL